MGRLARCLATLVALLAFLGCARDFAPSGPDGEPSSPLPETGPRPTERWRISLAFPTMSTRSNLPISVMTTKIATIPKMTMMMPVAVLGRPPSTVSCRNFTGGLTNGLMKLKPLADMASPPMRRPERYSPVFCRNPKAISSGRKMITLRMLKKSWTVAAA